MSGPEAGSPIPAGFTYLGQFVDHDLTFDKTTVALGEHVSPADLLQARSPSLDLDSLYGAGPADPASAKFYEADGIHLKMGRTEAVAGLAGKPGFDLPRGAGSTVAAKRKAIIPDPRNDENLAVAQTHLAFIRFHNRVVDTLPRRIPAAQRFRRAREKVVKHYQWMLRTDYLPRICAPGVVNAVFRNGRKAFEVGVPATDVPTMPIEFSVAAFRLGHSMIRSTYNWNRDFDFGSGTLDLLFTFSAGSGELGGGRRLPSNWIADFRRLYDFTEAGRADLRVPPGKFNRALRIDTSIANPLAFLPGFSADEANLAFRNFARARMVRLATGQQMVTFLRSKGVNVSRLTNAQLRDGNNGADLSRPRFGATGVAPPRHPALVLRPARGRARQRQAERRGRADRRRDVPPRHGGQRRRRSCVTRPSRRPSARTTRPSGWSTSCSSPSRRRRRCSLRSATDTSGRRTAGGGAGFPRSATGSRDRVS